MGKEHAGGAVEKTVNRAVGTYKGEPGGAKFCNIKINPNPNPKTNTKSTQPILAQYGRSNRLYNHVVAKLETRWYPQEKMIVEFV